MLTQASGASFRRPLPTDEIARNALLRRVDWRFLLPHGNVNRAVHHGIDTRQLEGLGLIAAECIELSRSATGSADLAVLRNPDDATLRRAWTALARDGTCYVEWTSPLEVRFHRANTRLRAAGFNDPVHYWAWPSPAGATARVWLPLHQRGVLAHFLLTRPLRRGLKGALRRTAQRAFWRLALRTGMLLPLITMARKIDGPQDNTLKWTGMNMELAGALATNWAGELGHETAPALLSWMLLTGGTASFNKVVGLVYGNTHARPEIAVKLARTPTADNAVRNEARALAAIAAARPQLTGMPRLLFCSPFSIGLALAETAVHGRPLYEVVTPKNVGELMLTVTDWFANLAGRPQPTPRTEWWPRLVEPTLEGFRNLPGPPNVPSLVARTRALFGRVADLPLTISHGDAGPLNVLIDNGRAISVIDWEDCELAGLPVADLVALFTYVVFHLEDPWQTGRFRDVYRATLDPSTRYGRLRAECLRRYCDCVGVDGSAVGALALVPWMERSLREHRGMLDASLGAEGRETFRRSLYVSLWQAELESAERA